MGCKGTEATGGTGGNFSAWACMSLTSLSSLMSLLPHHLHLCRTKGLGYNLAILSHVFHVEKGRAWVSDPAAARSENVALPFLFAWFALFGAKKVTSRFVPGPVRRSRLRVGGTPGGGLGYNFSVKSWALSVKRSKLLPVRRSRIRGGGTLNV